MKKLTVLLLAGCMLVSLVACGGNMGTSASFETANLTADEPIPTDELERAAWYGFLPEDAGDPDSCLRDWEIPEG